MNNTDLHAAVSVFKNGDLVVFPTDTVYGIGCDPFNEDAIKKLYMAKKRPEEKSIPVLVSSVEQAHELGEITATCETLIAKHWPGALTVVVKQKIELPKKLSWDNTVALRMPNHSLALELIESCGGAIATTSANISGNWPATTYEEVSEIFGDLLILNGGTTPGNLASTVVDCTSNTIKVLREGPVKI